MSGNNLQPLEEEVSKEENDSFMIQVDMIHPSQKANHTVSTTTIGSECNYNKYMEEAQVQYEIMMLDRQRRSDLTNTKMMMFDT